MPARPSILPADAAPIDARLENFLFRMPKVELHVHLEGALRPATLLNLAKKHGVEIPANDEAGVRRWLRFRDFSHFVTIYRTICRTLRDPEDFHVLALDFLAEQAIQNVVHSEAHFTIATHAANGVDVDAVRQALSEAVREGEKRHGVRLRLIPDIVRDDGVEAADLTVEWALAGKEDGLVVALGLSGHEHLPCAPFAEHFATASRGGLRRVAHAGEHGGPAELRAVLDAVAPERVDHGVRAIDDPALVAELAASRLPLTICPTSNVVLGVARDLAAHPFDALHRAGVNVSVNTDGPQVMQTNLVREYAHLHRVFGYSAEELAGLALQGLGQAFLDEGERVVLEEDFRRRFVRLGERYLGRAVEHPSQGVALG